MQLTASLGDIRWTES